MFEVKNSRVYTCARRDRTYMVDHNSVILAIYGHLRRLDNGNKLVVPIHHKRNIVSTSCLPPTRIY